MVGSAAGLHRHYAARQPCCQLYHPIPVQDVAAGRRAHQRLGPPHGSCSSPGRSLERHQPDWNSLADKVARSNNEIERADCFQSAWKRSRTVICMSILLPSGCPASLCRRGRGAGHPIKLCGSPGRRSAWHPPRPRRWRFGFKTKPGWGRKDRLATFGRDLPKVPSGNGRMEGRGTGWLAPAHGTR